MEDERTDEYQASRDQDRITVHLKRYCVMRCSGDMDSGSGAVRCRRALNLNFGKGERSVRDRSSLPVRVSFHSKSPWISLKPCLPVCSSCPVLYLPDASLRCPPNKQCAVYWCGGAIPFQYSSSTNSPGSGSKHSLTHSKMRWGVAENIK